MEEQVTTGVNEVPAAGENEQVQEEESFDLEALLLGDYSETGEDNQDAADPADEIEQGEPESNKADNQELPEPAEKAFAKKWNAKKDELEQEIRTRVMKEIEERTRTTQAERDDGANAHKELTSEQLERLAEEFEVSPKVANILYQQQQMINRQMEDSKRRTQLDRERTERTDAMSQVEELRSQNKSLPEWNDQKLQEYRKKYYLDYGTTLPWGAAYKMMVSDMAVSGDLARQTQQETIRKIQERDEANVNIKSPGSRKRTISDLSETEFKKLQEDVKAGKYTKR